MSQVILRMLVAGVLTLQGLGQLMGIVPAIDPSVIVGMHTTAVQNWSSESWLFTPLIGDAAARAVGIVLFSLPCLGFLASAAALLGWLLPHALWRKLALASAVVSLAALVCYWNAFILFVPHKLGDIAVNLAVILCLLLFKWPREAELSA